MDIKTRIDGLTEAEAKAALEYLVDYIAFGNYVSLDENFDIEKTRVLILEMALREAQQ